MDSSRHPAMKPSPSRPSASWRRAALVLLVAGSALLGACDGSSSGVGFSVGLPTSYGSMELGMATTQWVGSPSW